MNRIWKRLLAALAVLALTCAAPAWAADAGSVDNTTSLPDGVYEPDGFTFSGGTGRVTISCPQVTVSDGRATALITFSSPNYGYVRVGGETYYGEHDGDTSNFVIPVRLNADMDIAGMTTAMSVEHEVAYAIHIRIDGANGEEASSDGEAPAIAGLTWESRMELTYAQCFQVDYYEGGYALIDVKDGARYLVVPEGAAAPAALDADIVVLQQPLDDIYLAATSAMVLFDALDALDAIRLSGTEASGWYIENAVAAMESGEILYAGKYNQPDYELLVREDCDLAIESTMILHSPKVQEMIELLGIPVLIDRSSYETHPLGRTEWIKLYGVLVDREAEAEAFFDEQAKVIDDLAGFENTEKTIAFFYVNSGGSVVHGNQF